MVPESERRLFSFLFHFGIIPLDAAFTISPHQSMSLISYEPFLSHFHILHSQAFRGDSDGLVVDSPFSAPKLDSRTSLLPANGAPHEHQNERFYEGVSFRCRPASGQTRRNLTLARFYQPGHTRPRPDCI